jgi:hypothetical protein
MPKTSIIKYALANGLWTALYVILIGGFFFSAKSIFGNGPDNALIPMAMLLLFVFSAALTGALVLGRPILWYIEGRKSDAVKLFTYTLAVLFVVMILVFFVLFIIQ